MKTCRYCEEVIGDKDETCRYCGYNSKIDTLTPGFVKKENKNVASQKQKKISPGVRSFGFGGLVIIVFSLGWRYQGKIGDFIWEAKNTLSGKPVKKPVLAVGKINPNRPVRLIDVRSYKPAVDKADGKNQPKLEGIFFDPRGKSYSVIGGRLVSENQSIGNLTIKKINPDSVVVIQDGKEKTLRVNK
jgi:hypothetical protein